MLRIAPVLCALALPAAAQATFIPLNGQIWDGNGGPLLSGQVYHIVSTGGGCGVSVPLGQTLTIQPGAIVKIAGCFLNRGTIFALGTSQSRIVFTSVHDDTAGGDTNGNGTLTVPQPGDWSSTDFGGTVTCEWCDWFYGGPPTGAAFDLRNSNHVFRDNRFRFFGNDVLRGAADVTVERCLFEDINGIPVVDLAFPKLPQFVDNTAVNCAGGEYARIADGRFFGGNLTLDPRYSINGSGVFVLDMSFSISPRIPQGTHLTLPAGTVLKMDSGAAITSDGGRLVAQGTPAQPVVITSLFDDAFGGDTQNDGNATTPAPGDWTGLQLFVGDTSDLDFAILRYGGQAGSPPATVHLSGSSATLDSCTVEHGSANGIASRSPGTPFAQIRDCQLLGNAGLGFFNFQWGLLESCTDNVASGNLGGDHFHVLPERPAVPIEIGPRNLSGRVLVVSGATTISSSGSLTLPPGIVLKYPNRYVNCFSVNSGGALHLRGTAREPIVLTSLADDSVGGDTNGDGNATQPAPNQISVVRLGGGGIASLESVRMRYGSTRIVENLDPNTVLRRVRVEHGLGDAFVLQSAGVYENLVAFDCGGTGIEIRGTGFDLLHATVVGNGGNGIEQIGLGANVANSIVWGNGGVAFQNVTPALVSFCNGDAALAGTAGNIFAPPLFVDEAGGDLRLTGGSPCLNRAGLALARTVGADFDEHSRISSPDLVRGARPDMGAFERHPFEMSVAGDPLVGGALQFGIQGPAGLGSFFVGYPATSELYVPGIGVYLAGAPGDLLPGTPIAIGGSATLPIPNAPGLAGLSFAVQGIGITLGATPRAAFTNVERMTLR